jgi:hypothetical protein
MQMENRYKSPRTDTHSHWTKEEDEALKALAEQPERWSGQQIASMLHRMGFDLRSRCAVLGRLHRNKIPIKPRLPANESAKRESYRKNSMVRRAFLAKMGGVEPERHPSDRKAKPNYNVNRPKQQPTVPNTTITGKHVQPDAEALALPLEQLSSGMCHFPFGAVAPFRFCGRATPSDAEPYCQKHYRLTHNQHRGDYDDAL